jgi:putative hemolysin
VQLSPFSRFPVYEGTIDHIVGVLHVKEFISQQLDETPFDIRAMMHEPVFLPASASAYELLATLEKRGAHFAVVAGEFGGTAGIVTLEDLLEEVVGEVWDEFDADLRKAVTVIAPGHLLVKGSARLHELQEYVDLSRYAGTADSVGGLLLAHVDLPPRRGDSVELDGVTLRIEDLDGMTVESVTIFTHDRAAGGN